MKGLTKITSLTTSFKTTFKLRHSNHQKSFKFLKYKADTKLSNKVQQIKKSGQTTVITWKIVRKCSSCNPNSKRCYLCLIEKLEIATYQGNNLLTKNGTDAYSKTSTCFPSMTQMIDCCNFPFVKHIPLKIIE